MTSSKPFLQLTLEIEETLDWVYRRILGSNMSTGPGNVSYDSIKSCLVNPNGVNHEKIEHCKPFLPQNAFKKLVQKDRVKSTLRDRFRTKYGVTKLIDFYGAGNAGAVFLTLVQIDARHDIWKILQKDEFADVRLPVTKVDDRDDVICSIKRDGTANPSQPKLLTKSSTWSTRTWDDFLKNQWLFIVPIFREAQFAYEFVYKCRLPFVDIKDGKIHRGHFGTVFQLGLRPDHTDFAGSRAVHVCQKGYIEVGLKVMTIEKTQTTDTDVEKFYNKEKETLEKMRDLKHRHLVQAFAAYKRADFRCFIFPWARGGNLKDFWESDSSTLDTNLITWAINQMSGISDGIAKLHEARIRHGDIKPLNILYFSESRSGFAWGNLVVADVGLAKVHETYTKDREPGTTTKHGTNMYEPPEMISFSRKTTIISQKYDTWSLGCIFFEFIIWLLYGQKGLESFHKDLETTATWRFWVPAGNSYKIHTAVSSRIRRISNQLEERGALGRLIRLISKKLLVAVDARATAEVLISQMEAIRTQCPVTRLSGLGPGVEALARQRSGNMPTSQADQVLMSPSDEYNPRTSDLDDEWRTIPQNEWARILISRLQWTSLRPEMETAELCSSCRVLDFLASRLLLGRSLKDLGRGAVTCPMCRFLHHCLSKYSPDRDQVVDLSTDNDRIPLMICHNATPIISLYFDPYDLDSSDSQLPQVQVGLPLLPPPGSSQQFKLFNEWVRLCNEDHLCVTNQVDTGNRDILPTRLIDVQTGQDSRVCLIETEHDNVTGHYIALSHCWGALANEKRVCTYADNIDSFKKGIPFHALPRTFQDAVTITRALGVRYLWIDSLCIIQGDNKDWKTEAGKMEDVFSSAYCTIAASSSASSLDGFLLNRAQRAAIGIQSSRGTIYLAEAIDDFQAHVEQGILNTRGWVLQERALSRRTIHFTSTQVYWECGEGVHCETLAELGNRQSMFLGDSHFPTYGLEHYKDERIRLVQYLYQTYSGLNLTKASDRSKAILGLQKRLGVTFKSVAKYGVISAYFQRTFLWQADVPGSLSQIDYESSHEVPSWSWMALMGRIRHMEIPFGEVTWTGDVQNPFQPGFDDAKWDGRLLAKAKQLAIEDCEFEKRCQVDLSFYKFDPNSWKCVVVGKSKVSKQDGGIDQYVLLVRERSSSVTPPVYERVGVGILLQMHVALETIVINIA